MITDKILYTVNDIKNINNLKKVGIKNFLFPLKDFCVGYQNTYSIEEIEDNSFILINRILDNNSLDKLENILKNNANKIKGIVYDDFGVLYLINKLNLDVITINYQNHFGTNYESINEMLKHNDSVVVSTDLTHEEITEITKKTNKEVTLFLFGLVPVMYSRRTLLKNFYNEFKLPIKTKEEIYEKISDNRFIMVENEYGTVGYQKNYYNGFELIDSDNVIYFLVNPLYLSNEQELDLVDNIKNKKFSLDIPNDTGFLHKETIYNLKRDSNE
jgi:hypothetical protein